MGATRARGAFGWPSLTSGRRWVLIWAGLSLGLAEAAPTFRLEEMPSVSRLSRAPSASSQLDGVVIGQAAKAKPGQKKKEKPGDKPSGKPGAGVSSPGTSGRRGPGAAAAPVAPLPPPPPGLAEARAQLTEHPDQVLGTLEPVLRLEVPAVYRSQAAYLMARALADLGLNQLAVLYHAQVLEVGVDAPDFTDSLTRAIRLSGGVGRELALNRLTLMVDPFSQPAVEAGYLFYLLGQRYEAADELKDAATAYAQITAEHPDFLRARLALVATLTRMRQRNLAVSLLQQILVQHQAQLEADPALGALVRMNLARALYAAGRLTPAMVLWEDVPRGSPHWLEAHMELAWAHYRQFVEGEDLIQLNAALGELQSLTSPFFADRYLPEATLLHAQILYQLCRFMDGSRMVKGFLERYLPLEAGLRAGLAEELRTPEDALRLVLAWRAFRAGQGPRPESRLQAEVLDRYRDWESLGRLEGQLSRLEAERGRLETLSREWPDGRKGRLERQLVAYEKALRAEQGKRLLGDLTALAADLKEMVNQARLVQLTMVTAEKDLYEAAAAGTLPGLKRKLTRKQRRWHLLPDSQSWSFEGEFWADELGSYRANAEPLCPE